VETEDLPHYRVIQLGAPNRNGAQRNEAVTDLDSLVTHHPGANARAEIVDGVPVNVENPRTRSYAVIGAELQEIETRRTDEYRSLGPDQVLLIKDFMLEDSRIASGGRGVRDVDVPSPVAGYVGRVDADRGLVDILDREGGEVIARVRHMSDIPLRVGDTVEYGQSLGTQSNVATRAIHVHLEMDTRYYQQYENYIADLTSGRLAIDPERRTQGIEPLPVVDDGTLRIGESGERVRHLQALLEQEGYRGRDGAPVAQDGVYRLDMQPAVLAFQRDHGLPQTGDIDAATLALVPMPARREPDRPDHNDFRQGPGVPDIPGRYGPPPHEHPQGMPRPEPQQGMLTPDDTAHRNHGMYATLLGVVHERDRQVGREPDHISKQLACGLVAEACGRGLQTIGAARFNADGSKVGMTDTADLDAPWARTAVGDVARLAAQPVTESSQQIERIHQQQAMAQALAPPVATQGMTGPEEPGAKALRLG
jgi:hypothetical protein